MSGLGIDVDSGGNAYVAGWTSSSDYPTTGGALDTMSGGESDGIVTKLDPSGSSLIYSTLLGGDGPGIDIVFDIKVDASGTAYLAGHTTATDFPTTLGTFDTTHNGGNDAFVSRLDATGSGLIYSTFVGGGSDEESRSIALDASGAAVVAGSTNSADFPATPGAYNTTLNGDFDGSLVRLDATGATLLYSTYLGGTLFDHALGVALDPLGEAYVAGATDSADYPTTGGAFDPVQNGDRDALVTKLVPVDDFDGDGIADLIDLDPLNFSDEFSDVALGGMTTGRILSRGNQILTLTDSTDPAPDDGVRIAASLSGGPAVSIVQACSPPSTFFLDEGDVIIVTCTSVSLNVKRGTVEIDLVAEDGRTATAVVGEGNRLVFDSTDFTFFAPPTNPEAVVLIIGGKEILLAPGQTAQGITIDIMPGSDSNPIRCGNPRGVIPVAVLSTDVFDARAVDHTTVTFGPLGAAETHATPHGVKRHEKDVDGDGDIDLVLHFRVGATGLGCDATQATLSGETFGGAPVAGADGVRMIE